MNAICTHLKVVVEGFSRKSQRLCEGVTVKAGSGGGGGGIERETGLMEIRTVGPLMFLGNYNNDGLGEEFCRKKLIY